MSLMRDKWIRSVSKLFLGVWEGRKGIELVRPGNIPGGAGSCTTLQDGEAELTGQGASDKS